MERAINGEIAGGAGNEMVVSRSDTHVGENGFPGRSMCFHVAVGGGLGEVGGLE